MSIDKFEMPLRRRKVESGFMGCQDHKARFGERRRLERDIKTLDLDCIKIKLMDQHEGKGWPNEKADHVEKQYETFLTLSATEPTSIVPSRDVDDFWHQHILDTRKYAERYGANGADCQNCGTCQSTCGVCSSSCQASCGDHAVPDISGGRCLRRWGRPARRCS